MAFCETVPPLPASHLRDGVEDVPVEVGVVHDGGVSTFFARAPFWAEAVAKALAVAPLASALVERMRVKPQESHERVQLAHLGDSHEGLAGEGRGGKGTRDAGRRGGRTLDTSIVA